MKKQILAIIALAFMIAVCPSCETPELPPQDDTTEQPETPKDPEDSEKPDTPVVPDVPVTPGKDVVPDPASGISVTPVKPDADGACTISLKALETNEFTNYTGDVYLHIGIIIDDEWKCVESQWDVNDDKFKMASVGAGEWALEIPNIREFFSLVEPTTPIVKIGMVARSAAEVDLVNEKGEAYKAKLQTRPDQFVSLTDNKNAYVPFQPEAPILEAMPSGLKHGINYTGSNEVTLVFYEKDKNNARYDYSYVVGDFNNWERTSAYAMKRDDAAGCWWATFTVEDPSKEYRFQYRMGKGDSEIRVQDPYSEIYYHGDDHWITSATYPELPSYPEGARGFVSAFQIEKPSYSWQHDDFKIEDEDDLVIYELLLRDFTASGDLNGAITKLDYLKELGITAIELMPVQEFEGNDSWGYSPVGYFALDKAYGGREMYKQFIDECHARDIAVIIDVVYNHTTGSHPWARLYWNGSDNVSSNNPWYNVVTPHGFGVYQDLNHANQMVKDHINASLEYLIQEYHVDGFRFDLTKGFTNNSGKDAAYDQSRVDFLTGYYNTIKAANPDAVVILEHFVDDENYELGNRGMKVWRNMNNAYCQAAMGYQSESDFGGLADCTYEWAAFGSYVGFMESHDEERMGYKQTAFGSVGGTTGGTTSAKEVWEVVGTFASWDAGVVMEWNNGMYFADDVTLTASDEFKIRKDKKWDVNFGGLTSFSANKPSVLSQGGENMKVPAGTYDIWFSPASGIIWMMTGNAKPVAAYGIVGTLTGWGTSADIPLLGQENGLYKAANVTMTASDMFKVRICDDATWNNAGNFGVQTKGQNIGQDKAFSLVLGGDSQDMSVTAGTYDFWFDPLAKTIWAMTPGSEPSLKGEDLPETPHTVCMRRLGLNAAFFLTVPGPKMIWQFGELGYDYSINYPSGTENDRTSRKPAVWEYMDDAARKDLYDTYSALLQFRAENPRFFDADAEFRWYVSGSEWPGRYLFNKVDGKNMAIFGNFGSGSQVIGVELPHGGTWYNYFNRDEVWSGANHAPTLKEGEFVFLVDWK